MGRFCEQLRLATSDAALRVRVDNVFSRLQGSVLANYAGSARQDAFGSHRLAIYFPESRELFETDPDHVGYLKTNTHFPVEFVQTHRWADFLAVYYGYQVPQYEGKEVHVYSAAENLFVSRNKILLVGAESIKENRAEMVKIHGTGGTGTTMLAVREEGGTIVGEPGYDYWLGTQQF